MSAVCELWPHDTPMFVADVREEHGVDVLEHAGANEVRLRRHLLFGDARPEHDRAGDLLAFIMICLSAIAAVMLSGMPELCPSPWPGAPATIGSW